MTSDCDSWRTVRHPSANAPAPETMKQPSSLLTIDVVHQAADWSTIENVEAMIVACAEAIATSTAWPFDEPASATVALSSNAEVRKLNKAWRSQDKATNVLSFPTPPGTRAEAALYLGDVILAAETLAVEARDLGIPMADHFRHLVVHGILHLLAFDHQADAEAEVMERAEVTILAALGVANPYLDPVPSGHRIDQAVPPKLALREEKA